MSFMRSASSLHWGEIQPRGNSHITNASLSPFLSLYLSLSFLFLLLLLLFLFFCRKTAEAFLLDSKDTRVFIIELSSCGHSIVAYQTSVKPNPAFRVMHYYWK